MDKKKIVGIIVFAIVLTVYIWYPSMVENLEQRRIEAMFREHRYEEVYETLSQEMQHIDSWEYLALMRSEYYIGDLERFRQKLTNLIHHNKTETVQALLDEFGTQLSMFTELVNIDQMGGIEFKDAEIRQEVAMSYFWYWERSRANASYIERALELRGEKDEIDFMDVAFYYALGDIETLLDIYDEVIEKPLYHELVTDYVMGFRSIDGQRVVKDLDKHFSHLDSLDFPEELLRNIGLIASRYLMGGNHPPDVLDRPFFQENIYFNYYSSLRLLNYPGTREVNLNELNEREEYASIDGIQETLEVVNNTQIISSIIEISKKGFLLYELDEEIYSFNLFKKNNQAPKQLNYGNDFYVSNNRSYYSTVKRLENHSSEGDRMDIIIDSSFEVLKTMENTLYNPSVIQWVDDNKFYYSFVGDSGWMYDMDTDIEVKIQHSNVEFQNIELYDPYSSLYSIDEETYTVTEYTSDGPYYRIRNIKDHSIVYEMELFDRPYLGSCEKYIYSVEFVDEVIKVLIGIDKETKQKVYFPFYQIHDLWHDFVRYLQLATD